MNLLEKIQSFAAGAVVISSTAAFVSYASNLKSEISIPVTTDIEQNIAVPEGIKDYTSFDNWLSSTSTSTDVTNSHLSWF